MPARNVAFAGDRKPFRDRESGLQLHEASVQGPVSFLNPTRAKFAAKPSLYSGTSDASNVDSTTTTHHPFHFVWRSRDNRKGRHPIVVHPVVGSDGNVTSLPTIRPTSHPSEVLRVIKRMLVYYPIWDISWLVAYIFTWGSIVWCINGSFVFLPLVSPSSEFPGEVLYGGGITAFIGAVLFFELGSVLLMFEAVNANNTGCFGWAVEQLVEKKDDSSTTNTEATTYRPTPSKKHCHHHHRNKHNLVGQGGRSTAANSQSDNDADKAHSWAWFPTAEALKSHYLHELGFLASFSQFLGATIFSLAGITALPGISNRISPSLADGIVWAPQVVGGCGFIVSGTLYMLETQPKWYIPSFRILGWHIAFWNLIGGIGFTLSGALGFASESSSAAAYQSACSTFWGSFAFLIGSVLQLYESLQKNPVEVATSGG